MVNTKDRGGALLRKRFSVNTNDPRNPRADLMVFGQVKGYISVSPSFIRLMGATDQKVRAKVTLLPEKEYPFTIKQVKAKEGDFIQFDLKPLGEDPARQGYELLVWNTRTEEGTYRDFVMVETDLKEKPTLSIPVSAKIFGPVKGGVPKKGN